MCRGICLWIQVLPILRIRIKLFPLVPTKPFPNLIRLLFKRNCCRFVKIIKFWKLAQDQDIKRLFYWKWAQKYTPLNASRNCLKKQNYFCRNLVTNLKKLFLAMVIRVCRKMRPLTELL